MTGQISDTFIYNNEYYLLIGKKGSRLFSPFDYGFRPEMIHTACYQGYYSTYEIKEDQIFIQKLTIRDENEKYPPINGIEHEFTWEHCAEYNDLNIRILFDGELRLAANLIEEMYIHMGFQKPSAFEKVVDLFFMNGKLHKILDLSEEAEYIRGYFKNKYKIDKNRHRAVMEAFGLDMEFK